MRYQAALAVCSGFCVLFIVQLGCDLRLGEPPTNFDPEEVYQSPRTAEQLLQRMESQYATESVGAEFWTNAEKEKAIELLRKRYPFESVRDRLSFQDQDPPGPTTDQDRYRYLEEYHLGDEYRSKHGYKVYSFRSEALAQLHSDEVEEFIRAPGSGYSRIRTVSPYDLKFKELYAQKLNTQPVDSQLLGEPLIKLRPANIENPPNSYTEKYRLTKSGMPTPKMVNRFHEETAYGFASSDSLGLIKSIDEVSGFHAHQTRFREQWSGSIGIESHQIGENRSGIQYDWRINQLQLVSLLLHDKPRVYVSDNLPNMEELSGLDAETRPLNDFENSSLKKLRKGETLITSATPNRVIMLGAIRAKTECLQCHAVETGTLLGAFSYEILRDPKVEWTQPEL